MGAYRLAWMVGLLAGCVPVAASLQPAQLAPMREAPAWLVVARTAQAEPQVGLLRPLAAGTELEPVGTLAQGIVLRPRNRELVVTGRDGHEAWPVVADGRWTGLYLPAEKSWLALRQPISLQLETRK